MRIQAIAAAVLTTGLTACASNNPSPGASLCGPMADPPAPTQTAIDASNCPASTEVYLSAVFNSAGKPVGVGGGTDAGTGNKSDKRVSGGQNICWLATDGSGNSSEVKFSILFGPSQAPTANQSHESVNIHPQAPHGAEYKYTIWTDSESCGFLDPRFVIN